MEWKDSGPFWDPNTLRELRKHCKRVSPNDLARSNEREETFPDYYVYNAPSPYVRPKMDNYLSMSPEGTYQFGFNSKDSMMTALGLEYELYLVQFKELFKTGFFSVKAYLVEWVDFTRTETMFIAKSKQLIDQVFTWDDFVNNFG
jgi:hypothetical protein